MKSNIPKDQRDRFASHNLTIDEFNEVLKKFSEVDTDRYKIPCKGGYLNIVIEDGIPKITYHADGRFLVEMLHSNSLRFININEK